MGNNESLSFGGPVPFRLAPVVEGAEYDVTISSLSRRGDSGIARVHGIVIFVPSSKIGDRLRIRIVKVGRGFATGERISQ